MPNDCCHPSPATPVDTAAAASEPYTCPMHPKVVQAGPGSCAKCGMALEPLTPATDDGSFAELAEMSRRLIWAVVFTLPLMYLAMGGRPGVWSNRLQLLLATPTVLGAGWPFFKRGYQSVRSGNLNMFSLIALGTGIAYLYSVAQTIRFGARVFGAY